MFLFSIWFSSSSISLMLFCPLYSTIIPPQIQCYVFLHTTLCILTCHHQHSSKKKSEDVFLKGHVLQGRIQRFLKGALYVGHHGWPAKKILGFRWSKKAEITLETISFWQNISISIFKFSLFLSIKSYEFF